MRLTDRDHSLVTDAALSHCLSRDQIVELYFSSVCRANTRLRDLVDHGFLKRLTTPFFGQTLYSAGRNAKHIVGDRVANLLSGRAPSPRFVRHALATTATRIALTRTYQAPWRFEQQVSCTFEYDRRYELKPDGLVLIPENPLFIEVDLGGQSSDQFRKKLLAYRAYALSGLFSEHYQCSNFQLLTLTTNARRAANLQNLLSPTASIGYSARSFKQYEITIPGSWS